MSNFLEKVLFVILKTLAFLTIAFILGYVIYTGVIA